MKPQMFIDVALIGLGVSLGYFYKKAKGDYEIKLYVHKEHNGKITLCNDPDHK